jgi:hypothetical protein
MSRPRRKAGAPARKLKKVILGGAVVLAAAVAIGVVAILVGGRTYVAQSKTAEARNVLAEIAKRASASHAAGRLCPSASFPIPYDRARIRGIRYLPTRAEWEIDHIANAGFACLQFWMDVPQYYQYEYEVTPTGFVARAHGDLDGNGIFSTFEIRGDVVMRPDFNGPRMQVSAITETNPLE